MKSLRPLVSATMLAVLLCQNAEAAKKFRSGWVRVQDARSFWQKADITVNDDGKLFAIIGTKTEEALAGFTAKMVLILEDRRGNIIGVLSTQRYGVDGTCIPLSSASARKDEWTAKLTKKQVKDLNDIKFESFRGGPPTEARLKEIFERIKKNLKATGKGVELVKKEGEKIRKANN